MSLTTKHRSIQGTAVTLEYNKNIASRDKSDTAFKIHYLTWISAIKHENLRIEPFNVNTLLQRISITNYKNLKAGRPAKVGFWKRIANAFVMEVNEKGDINGI